MIETSRPMYRTCVLEKQKANARIREALKSSGLHQWELALLLGIGESTLVRNLRQELPEDEQRRIIDVINQNKR